MPSGRRSKQARGTTDHKPPEFATRAVRRELRAEPARASRRKNAKILATAYFPEELPPEYLRRWRA